MSEKDSASVADAPTRDFDEHAKKAEAIRTACDLRDIDALVSHATSKGGFLQDELRRLACMLNTSVVWQ
jgi:hypothetical protein